MWRFTNDGQAVRGQLHPRGSVSYLPTLQFLSLFSIHFLSISLSLSSPPIPSSHIRRDREEREALFPDLSLKWQRQRGTFQRKSSRPTAGMGIYGSLYRGRSIMCLIGRKCTQVGLLHCWVSPARMLLTLLWPTIPGFCGAVWTISLLGFISRTMLFRMRRGIIGGWCMSLRRWGCLRKRGMGCSSHSVRWRWCSPPVFMGFWGVTTHGFILPVVRWWAFFGFRVGGLGTILGTTRWWWTGVWTALCRCWVGIVLRNWKMLLMVPAAWASTRPHPASRETGMGSH